MLPDDPGHPPTGALPPTEPDDFDIDPILPGWPKPVGIISIVLASLSLTCGTCGVIGSVMSPMFMKMAGPDAGPVPPMMQPQIMNYVQMAIGLLWAGLLLTAGIMTLRRLYTGRLLHLVYAIGSIPLLVWSIMTQLDMAAQLNQWAQQNPGSPFAQGNNPWIGIAITVIFGLPWPLFCLIWFGVVKTKPEHFTGGQLVDRM